MSRVSGIKTCKGIVPILMKPIISFSLLISALACHYNSVAQFAPAAGQPGTTAVYKDSSLCIGWATKCHIVRGLQDISVSSGAYANVGDSTSALGKAGTTGVVSLGDGGAATLQFTNVIIDGPGPDLAVFENSFNDTFLELAFVEVSSDGIHFFRFPAVSNTDTTTQTGGFGTTDPTKINNLAGKYRAQYGTPFDLADIPDTPLLNKQAITHVKVIDVVGCLQNQYCTRDANQQKVNDPWPTAFGSGGFDLDAVGVLNHQIPTSIKNSYLTSITVYPNPSTDVLYISVDISKSYTVSVLNLLGEIVLQPETKLSNSYLSVAELQQGIYILNITVGSNQKQLKFIKS